MKSSLSLALVPLLLAGCSEAPPPSVNNVEESNIANGTMMAPVSEANAVPAPDTPTYLARAGAGDLFEIESSRAILAKTANADLKKFAQMMIDHHTQSTQTVKKAAADAKLTVAPPKLDPAQQTMLDGIKAGSGPAADQAYLDAQRTAHDQALALHQSYAADGDTPALKAAAVEIAPVVEAHITELVKLSR